MHYAWETRLPANFQTKAYLHSSRQGSVQHWTWVIPIVVRLLSHPLALLFVVVCPPVAPYLMKGIDLWRQ
jgi:hypothetical protein